MPNRSRPLAGSLAAGVLLVCAACGGDDPLAESDSGTDTGSAEDKGSLSLSGQNFTEMQIMAELYGQLLEDAGYTVESRLVATRDVYLGGLQDGSIDVVPEYAGSIADELNARANGPNAEPASTPDIESTMANLRELAAEVGLEALEPAEATDENAFAVTQDYADEQSLTTLTDLGELGEPVKLAAAEDCSERPDCAIGLERVYDISIDPPVLPLGFGTQETKNALIDGEVQLGQAGTSDGSLEELGLVLLEDDQNLQAAQNLVPVVNAETLQANPDIADTLNQLSSELTTEDLADMNAAVDLDRQKPEDVAQQFLEDAGLI